MIRLLLQFWIFRVLLVVVLLVGCVVGAVEYGLDLVSGHY